MTFTDFQWGTDHVAPLPDAPAIASVSAGDGRVTVNWNPPGDDGGSPITSYTVTADPGEKTVTAGGDARSATVEGLANGTEYRFTVRATNNAGDSPASDPSEIAVPARVPDAPGIGTVTPGPGQATVTWNAPATNGGSSIASYTVTASPGGKSVTTSSGTVRSATLTGLTNGTPYRFRVVATNRVGDSGPSALSEAVIPADVPGPPAIGPAGAGQGQATVTWSPPRDTGGSPITGYVVTASPGGKTVNVDAATSTTTIGDLTNGTTYTFRVQAVNRIGAGASSTSSNAVTPWPACSVPPSASMSCRATAGRPSPGRRRRRTEAAPSPATR